MTVVETAAGRIRGREMDGVRSFLGVPFAAAPTGPRRFRPPEPAEPWRGELEADRFGPRCPQVFSMLAPAREAADEDCLHLNVWTPAAEGDSLPVMVWIHGGSFTSGSGAIGWYHGARLAARGAVVVTVNYRLGALGFLHLEPFGGQRYAGSANLGLADQSFALGWIGDNIAAFGGDPDNVTLFGESAGAMSVSCHPALATSQGRFRRIIAQSGAAGHVQDAATAEGTAAVVLAHLGVDRHRLDDLETLPVEAFVSAVPVAAAARGRSDLPLPFQPTVDGTSLPCAPLDVYRGGAASDLDMVAGTTADEMKVFAWMAAMAGSTTTLSEDRLLRRLARVTEARRVAHRPRDVVSCYRSRPGVETAAEVWLAISTDLTFRVPALTMADAATAGGGSVRMYRFDEPSNAFDGALGAGHGMEIPYVFDNLDRPGVDLMLGELGEDHRRLAGAVADAWVGFATGGRPRVGAAGEWPSWSGTDRNVVFRRSPDVVAGVDDDVREMWM